MSGQYSKWPVTQTSSGTVTSVGLSAPAWLTVGGSPVTTSGTLALTGTSQLANLVLASPNGAPGALTPRALVAADIPSLTYLPLVGGTVTGPILHAAGSAGAVSMAVSSNAGTGMFFPSATSPAIALNGIQTFTFTYSSPDTFLTIRDTDRSINWNLGITGGKAYFERSGYAVFEASDKGWMGIGANCVNFNPMWGVSVEAQSNSTDPNAMIPADTGVYWPVMVVRNSNSTVNSYSAVGFQGSSTTDATSLGAALVAVHEAQGAGAQSSRLGAWVRSGGGALTEALRVTKDGQIATQVVGKGYSVAEGSNAKMGVVTLVGGTATVATTAVTANSRIFLTPQASGGTVGALAISARNAGTDFTITSLSVVDTSVVAWIMFEPS